MKYNTCEEIYTAFVKQGWSEDIHFEPAGETKGEPLFKMVETGNIFDNRGKIFQYNIPTK